MRRLFCAFRFVFFLYLKQKRRRNWIEKSTEIFISTSNSFFREIALKCNGINNSVIFCVPGPGARNGMESTGWGQRKNHYSLCIYVCVSVCNARAQRRIQVLWRAGTRCEATYSIFIHFGLVCGFFLFDLLPSHTPQSALFICVAETHSLTASQTDPARCPFSFWNLFE